MRKKQAFAITVEMVLMILLCATVVMTCLRLFSDNLSALFSQERNYKKIFERVSD